MTTYAILDFETTGMSPDCGACPTEIAVVLVRDGQILDRYQSLMNGNIWIPPFIQSLTGITNAMVRKAPPIGQVMNEAIEFAADYPLVAHNASFDRKFWDDALDQQGKERQQEFLCSMLMTRRVFPQAPNHKLGTLVSFLKLPMSGQFHRALADAEATAHLFIKMQQVIQDRLKLREVHCRHLLAVQRQKIGTF
ncbi:3'-5' exonuclease [Thiothrix subterranea]|uniref:Exonuclease domain-containing protein n=1 Tax=Thiothrix subterranea TaxID=2735563 RepID=A0AA51MLC9_9GAMM|nr:exonuclease domain-containing protein [Thiothrix subterranea]MDQ5767897.1 exonuclease domain-containing protein [Thiothrix subterranea]WML86644.1 exonuclease domain-containing protein [Thiothrix subterranea]